jgi:hypothetical protein
MVDPEFQKLCQGVGGQIWLNALAEYQSQGTTDALKREWIVNYAYSIWDSLSFLRSDAIMRRKPVSWSFLADTDLSS